MDKSMNGRYEMRFTGSGGQGVILASIIMAEAAIISGKNAVQSQAYGPEARGGVCKAETIISDEQIWFSKVIKPNFLLALTQDSLDKYVDGLAHDAVVLADDTLTRPALAEGLRYYSLPILRTAEEKVGRAMTANIVAVGVINALTGLFDGDVLRQAVSRHIPAGTEALNALALGAGTELGKEALA